jgi:hypothetical protein
MKNDIDRARDMQHRKTYAPEIDRNYENKTPSIKMKSLVTVNIVINNGRYLAS